MMFSSISRLVKYTSVSCFISVTIEIGIFAAQIDVRVPVLTICFIFSVGLHPYNVGS